MKRCKICGNDRFIALQDGTISTIVDSTGKVIGYPPMDMSVVHADRTYGPYMCSRCHKMYESLDSLEDSVEHLYHDGDLIIEIVSTFHPKSRLQSEIWAHYRVYEKKKFVTERYTFINPFGMESKIHPENCQQAFEGLFQNCMSTEHNDGLAAAIDNMSMMRMLLIERIKNDYKKPRVNIDSCRKITKICVDKIIKNPDDGCTLTKTELAKKFIYQKEVIKFDELCDEKGAIGVFAVSCLPGDEWKKAGRNEVVIKCSLEILTMLEFNGIGDYEYGR